MSDPKYEQARILYMAYMGQSFTSDKNFEDLKMPLKENWYRVYLKSLEMLEKSLGTYQNGYKAGFKKAKETCQISLENKSNFLSVLQDEITNIEVPYEK